MTDTSTDTDPGDDPGPDDDLTTVDPPECPMPDSPLEVPVATNPHASGGGIVPGEDPPDSPVVPEPGSIILLGIAGGIGGAGWLRRRLTKRPPESTESTRPVVA